ncbi:MAG: hypothetical protein DRO67_06215 [Candidatus Asgardarchaeum californiense]|nr:MAG: hypothetical protein DRO67_06215 [Candidatus Asgardarchaeum californiense]
MKRKSVMGLGLIIALLMVTSSLTLVTVVSAGQNEKLVVSKEVSDGVGWVKNIDAEVGDTVQFRIMVTYHNISGNPNYHAKNIVVTDTLPSGLEYIETVEPEMPEAQVYGNTIIWNFTDIRDLYDGDSLTIIFNASVIDCGLNVNEVNVTAMERCSGEDLSGDDVATVNVEPSINVNKEVWDGQNWADNLTEVIKGELVQFRITINYCGNEVMKCLIVKDCLPDCCFDYEDTTYVEIAGESILPSDESYPEITVAPGEPPCPENTTKIMWDWRNVTFDLYGGQSVVIIFNANVTQYCGDWVTNWACAKLWQCCPNQALYDRDSVEIYCGPPDTTFEKKVLEGNNWVDETSVIVGDTVQFMLLLSYYGPYIEDADIRVVDYLPDCLEYVDYVDYEPSNVSEDKKTIWWNLTQDLSDGDTISIVFSALVIDICCNAENNASIVVKNCSQIPFEGSDTVTLSVGMNYPPTPPEFSGDTSGGTGEELTFMVRSYDPEGQNVYYKFDWDGEISDWEGPYASGDQITIKHSWDSADTYTVKVKAKDTHDAESDWSDPLSVEITGEGPGPGDNITIIDVKGGFRYITATIKNSGDQDANGTNWTISVEGKLLKRKNVVTNGSIDIGAGNAEEVQGDSKGKLFGFGFITVTVTADAGEYGHDSEVRNGFIFGPFVHIRKAAL